MPRTRLAVFVRMVDIVGWASSVILVLTVTTQVHKQWSSGTSRGVSSWLFVGQFAASLGFIVYSSLIRNWIFVVTNGLTALAAVFGLVILCFHRRR